MEKGLFGMIVRVDKSTALEQGSITPLFLQDRIALVSISCDPVVKPLGTFERPGVHSTGGNTVKLHETLLRNSTATRGEPVVQQQLYPCKVMRENVRRQRAAKPVVGDSLSSPGVVHRLDVNSSNAGSLSTCLVAGIEASPIEPNSRDQYDRLFIELVSPGLGQFREVELAGILKQMSEGRNPACSRGMKWWRKTVTEMSFDGQKNSEVWFEIEPLPTPDETNQINKRLLVSPA
ncbi:5999_t:CDS:2 [Ambispora gerdemannii]|uniref:5999_t:CDS:1 n=1 Tax=Ambispora gerdemannii TaxID=144530 RepID=A0A9N8YNM9_9GLOM|nr:5999_t:CDS:2 [Ambispora gerdemannii]